MRLTWPTVLTAVLAVVVFGLAALVTLNLKHLGERGVRVERDLQTLVAELRTEDALEWRAISGRVTPAGISDELAASRDRARSLITGATTQGVGAAHQHDAAALTALHEQYVAAVDEELGLLAAGEDQQAQEVDETRVDPAFEAVLAAIEEHGHEVSAAATQAQRRSDWGVVGTVLLSLALTALAQSRRRRQQMRRAVERRSEARYRALVDRSSDLVLVTDRAGRIGYRSPAAERLLQSSGSGAADLICIVHEDDRDALGSALQEVREQRNAMLELRVLTGAGPRTFTVTVQDLSSDPAVRGLVLTGHDITERQSLQRELEHRALHDALTGLPNRALLADRFGQALGGGLRTGRATGLLLIDLDRFKEINDTLGHHVGDQLLARVGPRLTGVLRPDDTVARLGGDEFAVLLPGIDTVEAAVAVAEKLHVALGRPFSVDGVDLDVEASIGVVLSGRHGDDPAALMQRADIAMYVAKQRSLGVQVYDPASDGHSPERLALLGDLRRALAGDELFLHFQPKVNLRTGKVCGAEALVRWQHPERGLIPPDGFIPLAENTGLIGPLTTRVLDLALAQARRWADAGAPLQVAVNLSVRNLLDDRLERVVVDLLARHQVPARLLALEVTESAIMTDPVRAKAVLERLSALGIDLAVDDFGAGYTSLGQLKNLPISELKVDRSFVSAMEEDSSNRTIVRSVVELGHNLGLTAVAEGVESDAVLESLAGYSCDVAQGYHLSRPLTAEAFDRWREAWTGLAPGPRAAAAASAVATTASPSR
jgi:diguanylate cyclase (GGDEF)-like protein/PAS domain S-box-containing protein